MKKLTPFLQPAFFLVITITGILIGKFTGGLIAGAGGMLLLFVTVGKVLAKKAEARMDAAMYMKSYLEKNKK
jgi:hypothetical protein